MTTAIGNQSVPSFDTMDVGYPAASENRLSYKITLNLGTFARSLNQALEQSLVEDDPSFMMFN